jgi:hypothetical protein
MRTEKAHTIKKEKQKIIRVSQQLRQETENHKPKNG